MVLYLAELMHGEEQTIAQTSPKLSVNAKRGLRETSPSAAHRQETPTEGRLQQHSLPPAHCISPSLYFSGFEF